MVVLVFVLFARMVQVCIALIVWLPSDVRFLLVFCTLVSCVFLRIRCSTGSRDLFFHWLVCLMFPFQVLSLLVVGLVFADFYFLAVLCSCTANDLYWFACRFVELETYIILVSYRWLVMVFLGLVALNDVYFGIYHPVCVVVDYSGRLFRREIRLRWSKLRRILKHFLVTLPTSGVRTTVLLVQLLVDMLFLPCDGQMRTVLSGRGMVWFQCLIACMFIPM